MATPKVINQAAINNALAQQAANAAKVRAAQETVAAAQTKLATYGSQANIDFTKAVAPKFSAMSEIAGRIAAKAADRPELLKTQGLTLDQLKEKTSTVQTGAATYVANVAGITGAEEQISAGQSQIATYSQPIDIPVAQYSTTTTPETQTGVLAEDTFRNTLALLWGNKEASEPYVGKLYQFVSGFYKSGSTIDEAINLSIRKARDEGAIPEFTKRFAGIFALEDKLKAGQAVQVPTIKEFFAAEAKMGEILQSAGLGSLATQEFLGGVIGKGKSVLDVSNLVSDVFNTIDYAPAALKETLSTYFPGVDRASIAKAILTGEQGATELSNKIKGISVLSAAGTQGVKGIDLTYAQNIANMGISYQEALTGFGTVKNLERAGTIAEFSGNQFTSGQAQQAVFEKSAQQLSILDQIKAQELGRFQGQSGLTKTSLVTGGAGQI
jgi:hypothetical protein